MNEDREAAKREAKLLDSLPSDEESLEDSMEEDDKKNAIMGVFQQKIKEVQETNLYTKVREERDNLLIEVSMLRS